MMSSYIIRILGRTHNLKLSTFVFEHQRTDGESSCHLGGEVTSGMGGVDFVGWSVHGHILWPSPEVVVGCTTPNLCVCQFCHESSSCCVTIRVCIIL